MAKADLPMNSTQETPSTEPVTELSEVATAFRSAFGPGFLALFWGGLRKVLKSDDKNHIKIPQTN